MSLKDSTESRSIVRPGRIMTLIVICLRLALPSNHALALCIDGEGHLALEVAVDGACSGSRTVRYDDVQSVPEDGLSGGRRADVCCVDCTDIVLGSSGPMVLSSGHSARRTLMRPNDDALACVAVTAASMSRAVTEPRYNPDVPVPERPSICSSEVLRL